MIPLSCGSVLVSPILNLSLTALSVARARTHALCLSPAHICPHSLWVPVTAFLVSSVAHPRNKRNFQPLLPTLLQGMFCPRSVSLDYVEHRGGPKPSLTPHLSLGLSCRCRPARIVPSITHGLILAPWASSREREPAHLPGQELQPPAWPPPWSSAQLSAGPGHPSSGHCLVCFPGPRGRDGKERGRQLGKGKREEGEGPPSLIS